MAAVVDWSPVFQQVKETMFFILVAPRDNEIANIQRLSDELENLPDESDRYDKVRGTFNCNGFVVEKSNNSIFILTCAHALDHVFNASRLLSVEEANSMFKITLVCDHYESAFRAAGYAGEAEDIRIYVRATVVGISCANDLLLIKVKEEDLKKALGQEQTCGENHTVVQISEEKASVGERAMLISWPSHKHRTTAEGIVGVRRTRNEISLTNTVGYSMEILEGNIDSESGASGAPPFNGCGKVIGLVHAGFVGSHTFFVPSDVIQTFLASISEDDKNINEVKNTPPKEKRKGKDKKKEQEQGGPSTKKRTTTQGTGIVNRGRRSARHPRGRSSTII